MAIYSEAFSYLANAAPYIVGSEVLRVWDAGLLDPDNQRDMAIGQYPGDNPLRLKDNLPTHSGLRR